MAGRFVEKLRAVNPEDWQVVEAKRAVARGVRGPVETEAFLEKTRPPEVTERQRFVSSMPANAARKKMRSLSVGLNQKRCRTSIGPGSRGAACQR